MPAVRTRKKKRLACDYGDCGKIFSGTYRLGRHKRTHCEYKEREFTCSFEWCDFRANERAGLKCHVESVHEKKRHPCGQPGCDKTFSDPSSCVKHRKAFHRMSRHTTTLGPNRGESHQMLRGPLTNVVTVQARLARHVKKASGTNAPNVLNQFGVFALNSTTTFPCPSNPPSESESSSTSSSAPRVTSLLHETNVRSSSGPPLDTAVCIDCMPIDKQTDNTEHQANEANPESGSCCKSNLAICEPQQAPQCEACLLLFPGKQHVFFAGRVLPTIPPRVHPNSSARLRPNLRLLFG